jgi:hypothetical protein
MSNARHYAAKVTREVEDEIEGAVRLGRRLRSAAKNRQAMQKETDSLLRAVHTFFEYGAIQHMEVNFKKCSADCAEDDVEEEEDDEHYYTVRVEMKRINDRSNGGRLLSGTGLAASCEKELRDAIKTIRPANTSVSIDRVTAEFDAQRETYVLCAVLSPPPVPKQKVAVAVTGKKRERDPPSSSLPDEDECVNFYANNAHTWKIFGHDVSTALKRKRSESK